MSTSTALVGPLPTVAFRGGPDAFGWPPNLNPPKVAYVPPRNTLDPRYAACTEHRVACDCREAEHAEEMGEWRAERRELQQAFDEALAGHPTYQWSPDGNTMTGCMCTGCQIARAVHIHPNGQY